MPVKALCIEAVVRAHELEEAKADQLVERALHQSTRHWVDPGELSVEVDVEDDVVRPVEELFEAAGPRVDNLGGQGLVGHVFERTDDRRTLVVCRSSRQMCSNPESAVALRAESQVHLAGRALGQERLEGRDDGLPVFGVDDRFERVTEYVVRLESEQALQHVIGLDEGAGAIEHSHPQLCVVEDCARVTERRDRCPQIESLVGGLASC
jgi:hypothetical protein